MRLTSEQKELLEGAAAISGQPLTGFALSHLLETARDLIERHQRTVLSVRDGRRFLEILEADTPPYPGGRSRPGLCGLQAIQDFVAQA